MTFFYADKHVVENNRIYCRVLAEFITILILLKKTYVSEDCCYISLQFEISRRTLTEVNITKALVILNDCMDLAIRRRFQSWHVTVRRCCWVGSSRRFERTCRFYLDRFKAHGECLQVSRNVTG